MRRSVLAEAAKWTRRTESPLQRLVVADRYPIGRSLPLAAGRPQVAAAGQESDNRGDHQANGTGEVAEAKMTPATGSPTQKYFIAGGE